LRYGAVVPLAGWSLAAHRSVLPELVSCGYSALWAGEADNLDAITPLAAAAAFAPDADIGTAVLPAFTRGPGLLAMTIAGLADLAPGRVTVGIGASSPVVVRDWNAVEHADPVGRTRDVLRFLRAALSGERVSRTYDTFGVSGFRLATPPSVAPPLLVAALGPRMLRLAADEADGAVITNVPLEHVPTIAKTLRPSADRRLVAWLAVCPTERADEVRAAARPSIAAYFTTPPYAALARRVGWDEPLSAMWAAWRDGDRRRALDAVPDDVVDALVIHGSPARCREQIEAYGAAGVTDVALVVHPPIVDPVRALRDVAPRRSREVSHAEW
jgi:probable F420-dependent oxidoreductase